MSLQWKRRKMMHMRAKKKQEEKAIAASLSEEYKETIRQVAYLGKKGYTIPKAVISEEDMKHLYESLRVAPVTSVSQKVTTICIYNIAAHNMIIESTLYTRGLVAIHR